MTHTQENPRKMVTQQNGENSRPRKIACELKFLASQLSDLADKVEKYTSQSNPILSQTYLKNCMRGCSAIQVKLEELTSEV